MTFGTEIVTTDTVDAPLYDSSRLGASIEILVRQVMSTSNISELLPRKTRVYLPDMGSDAMQDVVAASHHLVDAGCIPVPHIAVRRVGSAQDLQTRLSALSGEAGVSEILLVAGDVAKPAGPYSKVLDILAMDLRGKFGLNEVGIAGHPEGRSLMATSREMELLRAKQAAAADAGLEMRIVTQFGFDAQAALDWADTVKSEGITLPVHFGIAGPAKLTTLIKYSIACGVGNSISFLRKRAGGLSALTMNYVPEEMAGPIEKGVTVVRGSLIRQFHVFPFGGVEKSAQWLRMRGTWPALPG